MFEINLPYSLLTSLPPRTFLHPRMFITGFDTPESDNEQYEKGLEIGRESEYVGIAKNGTWYSKPLRGGVCTSYEGIGYHRSTAALLKGFLDSGTEVYVSRYDFGDERIK
jgi:hypothetical protein